MSAEPQTGQVTSPPASCWSNASAEANQPSKRCSLSHPKLNTITSASPQCGGVLLRPAGYRRVPVEAWPKNGNPMRDSAPPACLFAAIANQGAHDTAKFVAAPVPCALCFGALRRHPDVRAFCRSRAVQSALCPGDEIGKHSGLKIRRRQAYGFESRPGHQYCFRMQPL